MQNVESAKILPGKNKEGDLEFDAEKHRHVSGPATLHPRLGTIVIIVAFGVSMVGTQNRLNTCLMFAQIQSIVLILESSS